MSKNNPSGAKSRKFPVWLWMLIFVTVLIIAMVIVIAGSSDTDDTKPTDETSTIVVTEPPKPNIIIENVQDVTMPLEKGLKVTDIGSYSGLYMENGKDTIVSHILMIVVTNTGDRTIQYAEIQLTDGERTANFSLTTLPPGESLVALELNQMSYAEGKDLTQATTKNVAMFPSEPSLCEDKVKIQTLNGVLNITNISGEDIEGDIVIYYKNAASDMLYGGITYRVSITGGLKKDEIRQVTASHFYAAGSRVMFVTIG